MNFGRRRTRLCVVSAAAVPLLAVAFAAPAAAVEPIAVVPSGSVAAVDVGTGNQTDAHVAGDEVVYTDDATADVRVHYKNQVTGAGALVPVNDGGQDALADISGTTVSYVHFAATRTSVWTFDTAAGLPPTEIDPQSSGYQLQAAIGGATVAVQDFGLHGADLTRPGVVAYDLATRSRTQLTAADATGYSSNPTVSPGGDVVSWTTCTQTQTDCQVFDAIRTGGLWSTPNSLGATDSGVDGTSDTNGSVVVYTSTRGGQQGIYWQPVTGGTETRLPLAGNNRSPRISGDLVTFDHVDSTGSVPQTDIYAYNLATGTLYRITDGPGAEDLSDVSVNAGHVRVVWSLLEAGGDNVYTRAFDTAVADTTAPVVTIASPLASGGYLLDQAVTASFACDDGSGSGVLTCRASATDGGPVDTTTVGDHAFTVAATDIAGNAAARTIHYTVSYGLCVRYDATASHRAGSTIPLKLQVCDSNGSNMSSAALAVTAGRLTKRDATASAVLATDSGNANPGDGFRYDSSLAGYIYNLSTKGLTTGTWALTVTVASDPAPHVIQFDVR